MPSSTVLAAAGTGLTVAIAGLVALGDLRAQPAAAIALMLTGFVAYVTACLALRRLGQDRDRGPLTAGIILFALLLRGIMLGSPPSLSDDIYRYRWDGKVQASGRNPYAAPPAGIELEELRDAEWARINYPRIRTIYPPLTQGIFAVTYALHPSLKAFQVAAALGDTLLICLLAALLAAWRAPPWRLALYALHPLAVVEFAGSGHFDAWAMAAVAGAALAFAHGRNLATGTLLGAGMLLKTWPLVLVPLVVRRAGWRALLGAVAVVGAGYAFYWHPAMVQPWFEYAGRWRFNDGAFWLLHQLSGSLPAAKAAAAGLGVLLLLLLWRRDVPAWTGGYWLLAAFILLMPTVHPWYMLWALPLAALAADWGWVTLCGLAPLAYAILIGAGADSNAWVEPLWPRFVIYGVALTIWLGQTAVELRPPAPDALHPLDETGRSEAKADAAA